VALKDSSVLGFSGISFASPTDGWTVGSSTPRHAVIEHWNGSAWTPVVSPAIGATSALDGVAALAPDDAWAVGDYDDSSGGGIFIEHWNGSTWNIVGGPSFPNSELRDIVAVAPNDVWAAGIAAPNGQPHNLIMHWNGIGWSVVPTPDPYFGALFGIAARSSADVWAAGSYIGNQHNLPVADHWDGTGWTQIDVGPPPPDAFAQDVAFAGNRVWLVGDTPKGTNVIKKLCPTQVSDSGFSLKAESVPLASTATWALPLSDTKSHSVTDGTGLQLFDSGLRGPGGSFVYTFANAGTFKVVDNGGSGRETLKVPPAVSPTSGNMSTTFTVTWASETLPAGYVADVQLKRPGASFVDWLSDQTASSATFLPDAGPGTYSFRARLKRASNGATTSWSPGTSIRVH
jgi:hypothetical protein